MKHLRVREIAKELDLEDKIIHENLLNIINEEKKTKKKNKYLFDEISLEAFVFEKEDLDYINDAIQKELLFLDLASHFNLDSKKMNWVLENLREQNAVEQEVLEYLREVKTKPSLNAYFEPETISLGEELFLVIEVNTEVEISEPKIDIYPTPEIEVLYSPSLPQTILEGRVVYRYELKPLYPGRRRLEAQFTGQIEGNIYAGKINVPELWVKSLPPELFVEKVPRSDEIFGEYNKNIELVFRITNRGKGEALNVKVEGLSSNNIRILSGENIGQVAVKARIDHPVIIRAEKSGEFLLDELKIRYEDGDGNAHKFDILPIKLKVTSLKPELKMEFDAIPEIYSGERFAVNLRIINIGKGSAYNFSSKIKVEPSSSVLNVPFEQSRRQIQPGFSTLIAFELKAPDQGEIVLSVYDVTYFDEEDKQINDEISSIRIKVIKRVGLRPTEEKDWPFEIGTRIDKYLIKEKLGEGGFAIVYLAEDTMMRTNRALKALKADYINDHVMVEEFINEARNAQKLQSLNIIRVFDVSRFEYKDKFYPYIVMEAVLGGTLRDKITPGQPMDSLEACYIARDICEALVVAHQRGIIHQDVKPSNIFNDDELVLWKLGDFGLAKFTQDKEFLSQDGTPKYMAPETNKTHKSDIYSLGLVMREMLTGTRGGNIQEIRKTSELTKERTEKLIDLIEQMTQISPQKRPELKEVIEVLDFSTVKRS